MNQLLLYDLFMEWNQHQGLAKLGLGDYLLLLQLIEQSPVPMQCFDDIVFTCETIWLKRQEQKESFRLLFEKRRRLISEFIEQLIIQKESSIHPAGLPVESTKSLQDSMNSLQASGTNSSEDKSKPGRIPEQGTVSEPFENKPPEEGMITLALGSDSSTIAASNAYTIPESNTLLPQSKKYLFGTEYFPVPNRVLQQNWRSLYNSHEAAIISEVDMMKTIRKICREGTFTNFEYQPDHINLLTLFIFIDQGGSMAACEEFGKELVRTAVESNVHRFTKPYFFYNVPLEHPDHTQGYTLYNEQRTKAYTTYALFKGISKKNIVRLIYSDAGAIKGNVEEERIKATTRFIKYICKHTAYTAWLNPAPEHRWKGTAAYEILSRVPDISMFEATRTGFAQAINALKGKMTQPIKNKHAITTG